MYVIIGGSTKCGTTSLYKYLTDHPEASGAFTKETRYFLDPEYPLKRKDYESSKESYESIFIDKQKVKIEATPDYLHSIGTPESIKKEIKDNYHIIFILRHPSERLISWYNFAISRGLIPPQTSFDDFIKNQKKNYITEKCQQYQLALEQGNYSKYIENYLNTIPPEKITIITLDELNKNPKETTKKIAKKIMISQEFYNTYSFKVENKTVARKSVNLYKAYISASRAARDALSKNKRIKEALKPIKKITDSIIETITTSKTSQTPPPKIPSSIDKQYNTDWTKTLELIRKIEEKNKSCEKS